MLSSYALSLCAKDDLHVIFGACIGYCCLQFKCATLKQNFNGKQQVQRFQVFSLLCAPCIHACNYWSIIEPIYGDNCNKYGFITMRF